MAQLLLRVTHMKVQQSKLATIRSLIVPACPLSCTCVYKHISYIHVHTCAHMHAPISSDRTGTGTLLISGLGQRAVASPRHPAAEFRPGFFDGDKLPCWAALQTATRRAGTRDVSRPSNEQRRAGQLINFQPKSDFSVKEILIKKKIGTWI